MKKLTTALTSATFLAFLYSFSPSAQGQNSNNSANSQANYLVHSVSGVSLDKRALLGGAVVSSVQVSLSSQVAGDVLNVSGKEGDVFTRGATLVTLEKASISAQKNAAYTNIISAREALNNAKVQYQKSFVSPYANDVFGGAFSFFTDPMTNFTGRGNPGFNRYANRTSYYSAVQQAKSKLIQAESDFKQAEERLKDTNIKAPFDGVIVVKNINKGDVVQVGKVLIEFANIRDLQVEVNVPSRLVSSLKLDRIYRIKLDIANMVVNAKLSQIYPIADNNKHSVKVKFDLPPNVPVLAGAYAEVEIFETDSGVLTPVVPESAILWRSSLPSIFVINPQTQHTELRFIRLGEQVGNDKKSILSGLKIGEKIVSNPNILMISGMSI
ncbi:MAG: efflux RND transporter periplasmic adaptor subunit [Candidatus Thioglobus sp.]|nr:efflux RND transporter periplasmic adaptor subunit [Candidatus Thioglobus sp.]